jgi:hypothetical protein
MAHIDQHMTGSKKVLLFSSLFFVGALLMSVGVFYVSAALGVVNVTGTYGASHSLGRFNTNGSGGNAGRVTFIPTATE